MLKPGLLSAGVLARNRSSRNWTPQVLGAKVLFWGKVSEIAGGHMPNKLGVDYITVAGSPATYTVPDNATYKTADEDYIWFTLGGVVNNQTTSNLIGSDFSRTLVFYDDVSPYAINEIIILKSGQTLTQSEIDSLSSYMHLSMYWSDSFNDEGYAKQNRPIEKRYLWSALDSDAQILIAKKAALGENPDNARQLLINTCISALKTAGYWTRVPALWIVDAGQLGSRLNWKGNDAFNLVPVGGTPTFEADRGWTTSSGIAFDTGYNPKTVNSIHTLSNAAIGGYSRKNGTGYILIAYTGPSQTFLGLNIGNYSIGQVNSAADTEVLDNTNQKGHYVITRVTGSSNQNLYVRGNKTVVSRAVTANMPDIKFSFCSGCTGQISYGFISDGLSDADVAGLNTIIVDGYLNSIGAKI
jgi:hypothetical protein